MIRQAKERLGLDFLVKPVRAVPGSPGRVLAIREEPNFICDYAYVVNMNLDSLTNALEWVLTDKEDKRAVTKIDMLRKTFGQRLIEIDG